MTDPIIPARFRSEVEVHLVQNAVQVAAPRTPLILGIHGAPGTGKSYQLDRILQELGVAVHAFSSSDFESDRAGEPSKLVRARYIELGQTMLRDGVIAGALVINDFDAAVGDWGENVQTTVNRQHVLGELMHLCDVANGSADDRLPRISIFLTANDLGKVYKPLLRPGRTRLFYWSPSPAEIVESLNGIFPNLTTRERSHLVARFPKRSLAFFADAADRVAHERTAQVIRSNGVRAALMQARTKRTAEMPPATLSSLIRAAEKILELEDALDDYSNGQGKKDKWLEHSPPRKQWPGSTRSLQTLSWRLSSAAGHRNGSKR